MWPIVRMKNKNKQNGSGLTLELLENPDILKKLGHSKREGQIVIGACSRNDDA